MSSTNVAFATLTACHCWSNNGCNCYCHKDVSYDVLWVLLAKGRVPVAKLPRKHPRVRAPNMSISYCDLYLLGERERVLADCHAGSVTYKNPALLTIRHVS